ncbi:cell division protein ZapE [Thalassotalea profundi]|uniref:Cell division protein ZapE n=1 Tax=Thalassotalea profundi TaxID=2036687 RepID=A0ABQ3IF94_9GAMM|nr:cell division protein ZapE [Thalassotalea profundi]GHE77637.1 cell division protein ZapE [Thalassotalea profundi]
MTTQLLQSPSLLCYSPLSQYQSLVNSNKISFDPSQQQAIELLQQLYLSLRTVNPKKYNENLNTGIKGVYLWGKVGRGKSFLMDLLVNALLNTSDNTSPHHLPLALCKRLHFHHFMQDIHYQLKELSGKAEPLRLIAKEFSKHYKVLCFDEFFVSDIGDAMLLGNLLQYLFELNIVVVSTSNCAPNELYRNGLQRERFLPAIAAIEQYMHVLHLSGEHDHRQRTLTYVQNYYELSNSRAKQIELHQYLLNQYRLKSSEKHIKLLGREIDIVAQNFEKENHAICFEFSALCEGPRSHFDYVELAKQFSTILLFNVPPMSGQAYERIKARGTEDNGSNINVSSGITGEREVVLAPMDDAVRRFIALVDECYDRNINLVITAYVPLHELYKSGSLMFEFERTKSRLTEMASQEYLDRISATSLNQC